METQIQVKDEEKPNDVVVYDEVGPQLAKRLSESGRTSYSPMQLQQRIQSSVFRKWGTQADRFQDDHGGGWIVDVTDAADSVESRAVIRSIHGTRMVTAVVEMDEYEEFKKTGQWSTPEAKGLDPELVAAMSEIEGTNGPKPGQPGRPKTVGVGGSSVLPVPAREPAPDDARLIVWWATVENGAEVVGKGPQVRETTYAEAQREVLALLMKGHRVEVWEGRKTPEIKVSL